MSYEKPKMLVTDDLPTFVLRPPAGRGARMFSVHPQEDGNILLMRCEDSDIHRQVLNCKLLRTQKLELPELTSANKVGDLVCWKTLGGKRYEGFVEAWDSNVAVLLIADGSIKTVEV